MCRPLNVPDTERSDHCVSQPRRSLSLQLTGRDNATFRIPRIEGRPPSHITSAQLLEELLRSSTSTAETAQIRWDAARATFEWRGADSVVDGLSTASARSSVAYFVEIGTAVRRLEILLAHLGPQ
jgi:hypothetical protein